MSVTGASRKSAIEVHVGWIERLDNEKKYRMKHKKGQL